MGNNKWNKEDLDKTTTSILDPEEGKVDIESKSTQSISGSTSVAVAKTIKVQEVPLTEKESKIEIEALGDSLEIKKVKIPESLIIPLEAWPTKMNKNELKAFKEYQRNQFPELFEIKNVENDKFSEVPFLKLTKPARIFASFLETAIKIQEDEKKKKIIH